MDDRLRRLPPTTKAAAIAPPAVTPNNSRRLTLIGGIIGHRILCKTLQYQEDK